jgi:putative hydrolase of the HAD superfamily
MTSIHRVQTTRQKGPTHLLTDLDDTLHSFRKALTVATKAVCEHLVATYPVQKTAPELEAVYKEVCQQYVTPFTDGRTARQYRLERMRALTQRAYSDTTQDNACVDVYAEALKNNLVLERSAQEMLQSLKNKNTQIIVVTEGPHDAQEETLKDLGIAPLVDHLFTSNKERLSKKDGLWKTVLDRLNITPDACVVLGDSLASDIEPAVKLGIQAVHYQPFASTLPTNTENLLTIRDLMEVVKLFD